MPCPDHLKIPSITLLFESACSPAARHIMVTCRQSLPWQLSLQLS